MPDLFIIKPRRNPGYVYVLFFDIRHFSLHIEPDKPKRHGYNFVCIDLYDDGKIFEGRYVIPQPTTYTNPKFTLAGKN